MKAPRPRISTSTPTQRSRSKRSHEPPHSGPSPADTDHPTRSSSSWKRSDYVERITRPNRAEQAKPEASPPLFNITGRWTYIPLCGIQRNGICGSPGVRVPRATRLATLRSSRSGVPCVELLAVEFAHDQARLTVGAGRCACQICRGLVGIGARQARRWVLRRPTRTTGLRGESVSLEEDWSRGSRASI